MELKTFITETLCQIQEGVQEAIAHRDESKGQWVINPRFPPGELKDAVEKVMFDVAVTATNSVEATGKGGLRVLEIGAGAHVAGSHQSEKVSRIQFGVRIIPPLQDVHPNVKKWWDPYGD